MQMDAGTLAVALVVTGTILAVSFVKRRSMSFDHGLDPHAASGTVSKEVDKKRRLQHAVAASQGRPPANGLPPGQTLAKKWIVLDLGLRPAPGAYAADPKDWSLTVKGLQGKRVTMRMGDIESIGIMHFQSCEWHCVTGWSATGLNFDGVPMRAFLEHPKVRQLLQQSSVSWQWLYQRGADGYTAPVAREDIEADGVFFAVALEGVPLSMEHGGPRIVCPHLFGWKSVKWLSEIEFLGSYEPGFWERCGCHARGRVEFEERFAAGWTYSLWKWLAAAPNVYRRVAGYNVWISVMQMGGHSLGWIVSTFTNLHCPRPPASPEPNTCNGGD